MDPASKDAILGALVGCVVGADDVGSRFPHRVGDAGAKDEVLGERHARHVRPGDSSLPGALPITVQPTGAVTASPSDALRSG